MLLLAIAWFLLNKAPKYNDLLSGIFVGITASMRPTFILLFIPFLIFRRYSFLLGGLVGILFSLLLSFSVVDLLIWKKYVLAMLGMTGFVNLQQFVPLSERIDATSDIVYPKVFEGFSVTSRNPLEQRNLINSSLNDIINALDIPNRQEILVVGFVLTLVFLILYLIKYNFQSKDVNFIFLFGTLMCLIGEFFIPVARYPYYDIQFMLPLLIIVSRANIIDLISSRLIVCLLFGLLLCVGCFVWIKKYLFFSTVLIVFYLTITSLILLRQQRKYQFKPGNNYWRL